MFVMLASVTQTCLQIANYVDPVCVLPSAMCVCVCVCAILSFY